MTPAPANPCDLCKGLDIKHFLDSNGHPRNLVHHAHYAELEKCASKTSCLICKMMVSSFEIRFKNGKINPKEIKGKQILLRAVQLSPPGGMYWIKISAGESFFYYDVHPNTEKQPVVPIPPSLVIGRKVHPAKSPEAFNQLRKWLDGCKVNHTDCAAKGPLPTRVINVGKLGQDTVHLQVVQPGQSGHYMALSHCWGKIQILRTLKANFVAHQKGIPLKSLTRTFIDAIEITRQMGIQFLWIDSLCIIQDSAQDWEKEAAKMGDVYRFSYLTIAAAYAEDGNGGILRSDYGAGWAPIKCTVGNAVGSAVLTFRKRDHSHLPTSPLHARAWVLQERILSPRTIHYDKDQMLWECRRMRRCQNGVPESAVTVSSTRLWDGRLQFDAAHLHKFWWDWYDMLEDFTGRGITVGDDRLPALSGIAHVMERVTKGGYVAGLWKQHFPWGLLWKKRNDWLGSPGKYRAPSWSWASLDGRVQFPDRTDIEGGTARSASDVEIIKAAVQPASAFDPCGKVTQGYIQLNGHIIQVDPRRDPRDPAFEKMKGILPERNITVEFIHDGNRVHGAAWYDKKYAGPTGKLYLLRLARCWGVNSKGEKFWFPSLHRSLILQSTKTPGRYRRIGMATHISLELSRDGKPPMQQTDPFAGTQKTTVIIE
ncbi:heterokaryon incompatibility protein-domain-containing protein [Podospora aff. communis PSN243]|uniref:Heterokaryon incompatibility protein-domain-containing protein n=1 Tax=Podospora aff. communis PSN243 TaxID=3040156 RepID=A0AAV9GYB7_9PEZI|nr:heterokaryon incompatibility protein-domain-containing protein [Podospora aff. communis PSN243]